MYFLKLLVMFSMVCLCNAALKCYTCNGLELETCMKTALKCKPEQNRCLSFLLEGHKDRGKIYYKRCAKKLECYGYKLQSGCDAKATIHSYSSCRPACCETDKCNHSNRVTLSWLSLVAVISYSIKLIIW